MEYGFTQEGEKLLEDARIQNEQQVREALRLQEEAEIQDLKGQSSTLATSDLPEQKLKLPEDSGGANNLREQGFDLSVSSPDIFEMSLEPLKPESQYAVREYEKIQHVEDSAPGLVGELTAGLTYDPVETRYNVQKVEQSAPSSNKNYSRFSASKPEMSFEDKLNVECKEYRQKQDEEFEQDIYDSPLYRRSAVGKYG